MHAAAGSTLSYTFWSLAFEVQFIERDRDELASAGTSVRDPLTVTFRNSHCFSLHIHNIKALEMLSDACLRLSGPCRSEHLGCKTSRVHVFKRAE